jgi:hypothetical protein
LGLGVTRFGVDTADWGFRALAGLSMGGFFVIYTELPHLEVLSDLYIYSTGHFPGRRQQF